MSLQLHLRSCYSLLESTITIEKAIERAKLFNYDTLVISDLNVMHCYLKFNTLCKNNDIKPVFALEIKYDYNNIDYPAYLYAKNNDGFYELIQISSYINNDNIYTLDELRKFKNLIIVFSSIENYFSSFDDDLKQEELTTLAKNFDFYLALVNNDIPFNRKINNGYLQLSVNCVAMNEVLYLENDDISRVSYCTALAIKKNKYIDDPIFKNYQNRYFKSDFEISETYENSVIENNKELISRCIFNLKLKTTSLPYYENKSNIDSISYLRQLCELGLKIRLKSNFNIINQSIYQKYLARLTYELDVITNMHFEDYFLIVYDFVYYAKKHGINVGPGRGSAAGSLVSYVLGITSIDPLKYNLLFERFLNPKRISMPDIDIDFPDSSRDEIVEYVVNKYGKDKVSQIITFGTLKTKQVIRDVSRVFKLRNYEVDNLAKAISSDSSLKSNFDSSLRFRQLIHSNETYQQIYKIALELEGLPRHVSTHAAGIIISKDPIYQIIPTINIDGRLTTQISMDLLENLGLIKIDFLGLRNLTTISEIAESIREFDPSFDIDKIPLDDFKTFKLIEKADVVGVFQLESDGMKSLIREVKPKNINDIALTIALYRPGPMENIPLFLKNRANPNSIKYPHPDLINILKETSGIIIYQEQIMQIAQKMASFSLAEADILRKAMSKKKLNQLEAYNQQFIDGCLKNGYEKSLANDVYELILKFANYGFNKSHSVAYSIIAYQLAYLKANYPLLFFCSLLNSVKGSVSKTKEYLFEIKKLGIKILPLSINFSTYQYYIQDNGIRFSLLNIKGLGQNTLELITNERIKKGPYTDYFDCVSRLTKIGISKKLIEILINAGSFDDFNEARKSMVASLEVAIDYSELSNFDHNQMTLDVNILPKPHMIFVKDDVMAMAEREKEVLGFYLSSNPITHLKNEFKLNCSPIADFHNTKGDLTGFGLIMSIKEIKTKKGDLMAFAKVVDDSSELDLAIMPNIYQDFQKDLKIGSYILFDGIMSDRTSCLIRKVRRIK